jgi:arylsulfatase A-like enzyme
MERRGALDNTIVIVASDHGEQLGEHGLYNHNNSLYLPLLHVPLLVLDPSQEPARRRVTEVVSLRDVAATVLDLVGVDAQAQGIGGRSLAPFWREGTEMDTVFAVLDRGAEQPEWYPVEWGPSIYSLTDSTHHYLFNGDGTEELYDHRVDPGELRNLARDPGREATLEGFRATLRGMVPSLPPVQPGPVAHPRPPAGSQQGNAAAARPPAGGAGARPPA